MAWIFSIEVMLYDHDVEVVMFDIDAYARLVILVLILLSSKKKKVRVCFAASMSTTRL